MSVLSVLSISRRALALRSKLRQWGHTRRFLCARRRQVVPPAYGRFSGSFPRAREELWVCRCGGWHCVLEGKLCCCCNESCPNRLCWDLVPDEKQKRHLQKHPQAALKRLRLGHNSLLFLCSRADCSLMLPAHTPLSFHSFKKYLSIVLRPYTIIVDAGRCSCHLVQVLCPTHSAWSRLRVCGLGQVR